mmetsp:Transcript_2876/g.4192  ORF Transcript_2876/g.4192 Transcript_2876/m.4192 type:complete len:337 (+) Transcript_2876:357-1367(+)
MSSFADRLRMAMGPGGYDNSMRRSIQTACLYEARRCLKDRMPGLRPFQRKVALLDVAQYLLKSADYLNAQVKEEVMYRTATSKELLNTDVAWKRMKLIEREVQQLINKMKPHLTAENTTDQACEAFIQTQYEAVTHQKKPHPKHWEHTHTNVMLTYRMYFDGENLRSDLPPAKPPKQIVVPASKPDKKIVVGQSPLVGGIGIGSGVTTAASAHTNSYFLSVGGDEGSGDPNAVTTSDINDAELEAIVSQSGGGDASSSTLAAAATTSQQQTSAPCDERRLLLKEVREHLDLLKEFEGVIAPEELNKRKRELFISLPSAPPPAKLRKSMGGAGFETG